ncbi:MAG: hypothetical protein KGJ02_03790 [Verrucomicrobiota bacterium]|nr:hypothetical protein [Verrucomicrobiota bacterium]
MTAATELNGNLSIFRCAECKSDTLGGKAGFNPFFRDLHQNGVFEWKDKYLNLKLAEKNYSVKKEGDFRIHIKDNEITIDQLPDNEPSSARTSHQRFCEVKDDN